jgi:hypothetical protein
MNILGEQINALLRQADIEGLLQAGAPIDEYASEAEIIVTALSALDAEQFNVETVELVLIDVWSNSFDISEADFSGRRVEIRSLANNIVEAHKIGKQA